VDLLKEKSKDSSFILKSTQQECISRDLSPFKTCCPINKDLVVNESFRKSELTLRHLNSIKYKAAWMCWQSLLNLDENTPKSLQAVLSRIEICVSKEIYFTDVNAYGEFQTKNEKNTLKLNASIDFSVVNETDCAEIIQMMWTISEKLNKIVV